MDIWITFCEMLIRTTIYDQSRCRTRSRSNQGPRHTIQGMTGGSGADKKINYIQNEVCTRSNHLSDTTILGLGRASARCYIQTLIWEVGLSLLPLYPFSKDTVMLTVLPISTPYIYTVVDRIVDSMSVPLSTLCLSYSRSHGRSHTYPVVESISVLTYPIVQGGYQPSNLSLSIQ